MSNGHWCLRVSSSENFNNITITAVYKGEQTPTYAPEVSIADTDMDKGSLGGSPLEFIDNTDVGSTWKLTATPAAGYQLAYIQAGDDESTRVDSEDGTTITWDVTTDGAEYTAYFTQAHFILDTLVAAPYTSPISGINRGQISSKPISAGQRVGLCLQYSIPSEILDGTAASFRVYAGTDTSAAPLLSHDQIIGGSAGKNSVILVMDSMPQVNRVTVTAKLGANAEPVQKTYDVTVTASGNAALDFLGSPQSSEFKLIYPSDVKTMIGGPNVYDAAAFVDDATGKLRVFLAVNGGVMTLTDGGSEDLAYMPGMAFSYKDNEISSGYAFAVGGADKEHLAALVKDNSAANASYCVYFYNTAGEKWEKDDSSILHEGAVTKYTYGLVMSQNDIWVCDSHWNGSSWSTDGFPSGVTFNSFWKQDANTAYAGSADGLYKYSDGAWSKADGTSGKMYITSAAQSADGTVTLVTADNYNISGRASFGGQVKGTVNNVIVSGGGTKVTPIDISGIYDPEPGGSLYAGVAHDGTLWAATYGRSYYISQFGDYKGANLYKYVSGEWQYQIVDAFNDATDNANIAAGKLIGDETTNKSRPDGVRYLLNPCEGVTLFVGNAGAIYTGKASSTITFNTDGGSAVVSVTNTIGSSVTAPISPTKTAYNFGGWYADAGLSIPYSFAAYNVMPAKDITLYARWVPKGGADTLADERTRALDSLDVALAKFKQTDYTTSDWNTLIEAYNSGKSNINSAETYDDIYAALNNAIAAMGEVPASKAGMVTVAASMDANTLGLGYIIKPTLVTVSKGTKASKVIADLLAENSLDWEGLGDVDTGFYLAQVYPVDQTEAVAADFLASIVNPLRPGDLNDEKLGEFDYYGDSGWMYSIGSEGSAPSFPGVGASSWYMDNGEVMRWQFTLVGYGADLNADNSSWGSSSLVPDLGDKTALTWAVAELREQYTDQLLEGNPVYMSAINALTNPEARQTELDSTLTALNKASFSENSTYITPSVTAKDGAAAVSIKADELASAVSEANKDNSEAIVIAPVITGTAEKISVELPKTALSSIASETTADLIVNTPVGSVTIPNDVLASVASQASGSTISVVVESVETKALTAEQQKAVGDKPVYDVTIKSRDKQISTFNGGKITISLPYTLKEGETAEDVHVWYLNDAGELKEISCSYDPATGLATFTTDHLSYYTVGIDKDKNEDAVEAKKVDDLIAKISDPVTLSDKTAIEEARAAYNALTEGRKKLVTKHDQLQAAEAAWADLLEAKAVEDRIAAIGTVTLESKSAIDEARRAYNALSPAQAKLVSNYQTLVAAEKAYAVLKADRDDAEAAKKVDDLIAKIGDPVTLADKAKIEEARAAYNALTEGQKNLVTKLDQLKAAEAKLAELQEANKPSPSPEGDKGKPAADGKQTGTGLATGDHGFMPTTAAFLLIALCACGYLYRRKRKAEIL